MHAELSHQQTKNILMDIAIPPCPSTLTTILRETQNPTTDFASLALLINQDAGILGPLLKLANSSHVGLSKKVSSAFQALSVLGMQNTLNLVQNISIRQSVGGDSQRFESFWERSTLEALIAEKVARKLPNVNKSDAYLATLFHDCGIPILMMKFPKYAEVMREQSRLGVCLSKTENDIFYTNHTVIGNMLTRNWMLPAHISKAILHHHDLLVFNSDETPEVCDLIGVMHIAQYIVDEHFNAEPKEWHRFERGVLKHFAIASQELLEIKNDLLAYLNDE
ncbi:MAG: HDOD domain-containing protein [Gallionellaceae bacterium]